MKGMCAFWSCYELLLVVTFFTGLKGLRMGVVNELSSFNLDELSSLQPLSVDGK